MPNVIRVSATPNHLLLVHDAVRIVEHLRGGGVAVVPTDTGYLLGADALNEQAVERVFELKGRPSGNPIHVVVSSVEMADRMVRTTPDARAAMTALLPGPLTVVCPKREHVSDRLTAGTGTLGIRIPDSPAAVQLASLLDSPLTATSLNLSGRSPYGPLEDLLPSLLWEDDEPVYAVLDRALVALTTPSTVVSFATEPFRVVREGPVSADAIAEAIDRGGAPMSA